METPKELNQLWDNHDLSSYKLRERATTIEIIADEKYICEEESRVDLK